MVPAISATYPARCMHLLVVIITSTSSGGPAATHMRPRAAPITSGSPWRLPNPYCYPVPCIEPKGWATDTEIPVFHIPGTPYTIISLSQISHLLKAHCLILNHYSVLNKMAAPNSAHTCPQSFPSTLYYITCKTQTNRNSAPQHPHE